MYLLLLFLLLVISYWYVYIRKRNKYRLPPGPTGLPIIGHIHQLVVKNPYETFSKWADQYVKIYTIDICTKKAVVINDPILIRDVFGTFASTGKFQTDSGLLISQGSYGVLNSDGEVWSEQRKFCVKKLKEFGFGNKRMETIILSEADEVCNWITKTNTDGKSLILQPIFIQSVINTVRSMVVGSRISFGDATIGELMENWTVTFQRTMKTGLLFLPWLKYVVPELSGYTAYNKACLDVINYVEKEFMDHKNTFVAGAQRDLIDAYIEESRNDPIKWKHAVATVVELFIAASETTGSTLSWVLCYLCVNSDIQKKLQKEIDQVIGEDGQISLDYKSRMPYTEAVILEIMRMSSVAPMGTIHRLLDDLEINYYKLPKDLILIANLYHCHHNKSVWGDPEVFRPKRFLDESGTKLKGQVIPFQLGKRECVGAPYAKDILFIFVTRIFQQFDVSPDNNVKPEEYYKPDIGFLHFPPPLGVVIKPRAK